MQDLVSPRPAAGAAGVVDRMAAVEVHFEQESANGHATAAACGRDEGDPMPDSERSERSRHVKRLRAAQGGGADLLRQKGVDVLGREAARPGRSDGER